MREAVRRIVEYPDLKRIIVTTNALLIPAQRNYESAGFVKEIPHNMGSSLTDDFQPSAACKFTSPCHHPIMRYFLIKNRQ